MATRGTKTRSTHIREFITANVSAHPLDITRYTAEKFGISRQAAHKHIKKLIDERRLISQGETRDKRYELKPIAEERLTVELTPKLQEDVIWREKFRPLLRHAALNVLSICEYGFTEILNNAIAHSGGARATISLKYTPVEIQMVIRDNGIGIFRKIQSELHLDDQRHAILELAKGKLTTDPVHHTGEGIFFTSRVFDQFTILSGALDFTHRETGDDWLLEDEEAREGTTVFMRIHPKSKRKLQRVFDKFASSTGDYGFTRTHVPVTLARYGGENLVSRSQAKRLLARFDRFREVFLDFKNVETIGQAFADEIFRVFPAQNPQVHIVSVNANQQIADMIRRAQSQ